MLPANMKLDRAYQLELLNLLTTSYPRSFDIREMARGWDDDQERRYAANMVYLDEHGLVESTIQFGMDGHMSMALPKITARGMDFLADDGGLSAVLGVVTVKLHEDTLKELIGQRIAESDLPQEEKSTLLEQVRSLPGETIKHLTMKLVDAGLANWPTALQAIETFARGHGI